MVHSTRPPVPTETFLVFRSLWIEGETCIWDINLAHLCGEGEKNARFVLGHRDSAMQ